MTEENTEVTEKPKRGRKPKPVSALKVFRAMYNQANGIKQGRIYAIEPKNGDGIRYDNLQELESYTGAAMTMQRSIVDVKEGKIVS